MLKPRKKVVTWQGHKLTLYSVGWLAYMSNCKQRTLRFWESEEIIPKPLFSAGFYRWYCVYELQGYSAIISKHLGRGSAHRRTDLRVDLQKFNIKLRKWMDSASADEIKGMARASLHVEESVLKRVDLCQQEEVRLEANVLGQSREYSVTLKQLRSLIDEAIQNHGGLQVIQLFNCEGKILPWPLKVELAMNKRYLLLA